MPQLDHEPETKPFNKVRDIQDQILRCKELGYDNPSDAAKHSREWFRNAPEHIQDEALDYIFKSMWNTAVPKRYTSTSDKRESDRTTSMSPAHKEEIRKNERARLDKLWATTICSMTFAHARRLRKLPEAMISQGRDDQLIGEVFTPEQLIEATSARTES